MHQPSCVLHVSPGDRGTPLGAEPRASVSVLAFPPLHHFHEGSTPYRDSSNPATLLATILDTLEQLEVLYKYWRFSIQERKLATFLLAHR